MHFSTHNEVAFCIIARLLKRNQPIVKVGGKIAFIILNRLKHFLICIKKHHTKYELQMWEFFNARCSDEHTGRQEVLVS